MALLFAVSLVVVGLILSFGLLLGLFAGLIVLLLFTAGVFSSATLVALITQSPLRGFQTLILQLGVAAGAFLGAFLGWMIHYSYWQIHDWRSILFGGVAGAIGCVILIQFIFFVGARLQRFVTSHAERLHSRLKP